jgi:O-antigen/teichoic acid export membrane protein
LSWVALGYALSVVQQVVETRLMSLTHSKRLILPAVLAAVSNIGLNAVLIPRAGALGAAWATAGSFAVGLAGSVWMLYRAPSAPAIKAAGAEGSA